VDLPKSTPNPDGKADGSRRNQVLFASSIPESAAPRVSPSAAWSKDEPMAHEPSDLIFPLSQRPEWRADPNALTILKTVQPDRYAAKQWFAGRKDPIDYAQVRDWYPFVALADGIEALAAIIERASQFPRLTVIRGAVRETSVHNPIVNRRKTHDPDKSAPDIEDVPRRWLMIDLDSQPKPRDFNWRKDPQRAAIWAVQQHLPRAFRNSPFYYQYSGSAGIKPGLRLHFWFWLETPANSLEVKRYLEGTGKGKVDLGMYEATRPHYTARPIFIRRDDPMAGNRGGLVL
jgi:hypothetical protein